MQDFIAILIVLVAAGYLGRVAWLRVFGRHQSTCGTCKSCNANARPAEKQLVQIDIPFSP